MPTTENRVSDAKLHIPKKIADGGKISYEDVRVLFKQLDINPAEFSKHSQGHIIGWFPDLPERKSTINVKKLAKVMWQKGVFS